VLKPATESSLFDAVMSAFGRPRQSTLVRAVAPERAFDLGGARVLVVDDNEINREVAGELLQRVGVRVSYATNGEEAVAAVLGGTFDAVLMDVQMPVMDGFDATRRIRASKDVPAGLPIIAVTAHARAEDADRTREAGMNGHVQKPIDPDELLAVLARAIGPRAAVLPLVPADRPVQVAPGDALPESLPGIDMDAGLRRVAGNRALYRKLLASFRRDFVGAVGDIRRLLGEAKDAEARRLAHSVRGVAGQLGAKELQEAAAAVESALRADRGADVESHLTAFERALRVVVEGVAVLGA
jgi:two-component system sensor histidine kinase/response regulator